MRTKYWAGNVDRTRPRNRTSAPGGGHAALFRVLWPRGAARSPSRSCRDRRPFKGLSRLDRAAGSDPALHAHRQAAVARSASAPPADRMSDAGRPAIRPSVWNDGGAVMRWGGRLPRARPEPAPRALARPARWPKLRASAACPRRRIWRIWPGSVHSHGPGQGRRQRHQRGPRSAEGQGGRAEGRQQMGFDVSGHHTSKSEKGMGDGGHCSAAGPWDDGHLSHAAHGAGRGVRGRQRPSLRRGRTAKGASETWDGTP